MKQELTPKFSFRDTAGKAYANPRPVTGERRGVFLLAGQSLASNAVDTTYTPTNPSKIENLNFWDGGLYVGADPLLGTSDTRGNLFTYVADKLIGAGIFDRVILIPIAMGGTSVSEWVPGQSQYEKLFIAMRRAAASNLDVNAVLWQQGEQDAATFMPSTMYRDLFTSMHDGFKVVYPAVPWILAKSTTYGNSANGPGIRAAIDALVNGVDIRLGPDCDLFNGLTYRYDYVHPNAAGRAAMGDAWVTALDAIF
jgi:hypothetical protein